MTVHWTLEALERLIEIEDFIARDNPRRAEHFIEVLVEQGQSLTGNPLRGRSVPETADPQIREILVKNYRIVYRFSQDQIEILTVFEGHRRFRIDEIKE
jgi:toxin ParE1/3/4